MIAPAPLQVMQVSIAVHGLHGDALIAAVAEAAGIEAGGVQLDPRLRAFAHYLADVLADEAGTLTGALAILQRAGVRRTGAQR